MTNVFRDTSKSLDHIYAKCDNIELSFNKLFSILFFKKLIN